MQRVAYLWIPFLLMCWNPVLSQDEAERPKGKLKGYMFGDYFYNIQHNDSAQEDLNGFQFRRIYFTYDYSISESFDSRFRLEADQKANASNGKIGVFVKDAYLRWKNIFEGSDAFVGISPTPAKVVSERIWGYRSLEKTITDLHGIVSSRDIGVDLKGRLDARGLVNYWFKIGNNSGNRPETDKHKRFYGLLHLKPTSKVEIAGYADYATRVDKFDSFDGRSKSNDALVAAAFGGYTEKDHYSVGLEGFYRSVQNNFRRNPTQALEDESSFGVSAFAWVLLVEKVHLIGRYDFLDPNTRADDDGNSLVIGAIDYMPTKKVHLMPNLRIQIYQADIDTDVVGRFTFYYLFK